MTREPPVKDTSGRADIGGMPDFSTIPRHWHDRVIEQSPELFLVLDAMVHDLDRDLTVYQSTRQRAVAVLAKIKGTA